MRRHVTDSRCSVCSDGGRKQRREGREEAPVAEGVCLRHCRGSKKALGTGKETTVDTKTFLLLNEISVR